MTIASVNFDTFTTWSSLVVIGNRTSRTSETRERKLRDVKFNSAPHSPLCVIFDIELKSGRVPSGKSDETAF